MPIVIILLISLTGHALELRDQQGKLFKFKEMDGNRVSHNCQQSSLALRDYHSKFKDFKRLRGNPASEFCAHIGGKDLIVSHPNLDQDSLCLFKDGSFILSWDLYRKNQKATK